MENRFLERAMELIEELVKQRRDLHRIPETGLALPETAAYITAKLDELGIRWEKSVKNSHITAVIGQGEKCILLRSDMDALPVKEESGLEFASDNGKMHACGHDFHASILLTAARMLKERESELNGKVKLLFQSGEEIFMGAATAIEEGVLENPKVDAAFAMHVFTDAPVGVIAYGLRPMAAVYGFRIDVKGKGTHGSCPERGISPINAGVHIYLALQEIIAREVSAKDEAVITIGQFESGKANNVIPEYALLQGTLRVFDPELRKRLIERISEVTEGVAKTYRCEAKVTCVSDCPATLNDKELMEEFLMDIEKTMPEIKTVNAFHALGSEDFAFFTDKVRSCYFALGARPDDYPVFSEHNPKVRHNEKVLPLGAAIYAQMAFDYLGRR